MDDLRITLIQSDLHWQRIEANLAHLEEKIWQIEGPSHLIILPEMFNTGYTMSAASYAEPMNGKTFRWMKQMAAQTRSVITGSCIIWDQGHYYNRLLWMKPDGTFLFYDKRHLFRIAEENHYFTAGNKLLITELNGWKICPLICYDLRFPVWSRNIYLKEQDRLAYDLVIFIANWPATRIEAWDSLLQARAIENISYSLGVNRVGSDGNGIPYNGHSAVFNPAGKNVLYLHDKQEMKTVTLSFDMLKEYREKFPFYLDSDYFLIK
jgi:predicted amidohydrolase